MEAQLNALKAMFPLLVNTVPRSIKKALTKTKLRIKKNSTTQTAKKKPEESEIFPEGSTDYNSSQEASLAASSEDTEESGPNEETRTRSAVSQPDHCMVDD